jgi:RluA family pseudouridine synthase
LDRTNEASFLTSDPWKKARFFVGEGAARCKVVDFVHQNMDEPHSKREVRRAIEHGQMTINGKVELRASHRCAVRDRIELHMSFFHRPIERLGYKLERVLYEDEELIAYDKPPFVTCDEEGIISVVRCGFEKAVLCHRLDAETSGVLLFAKQQSKLQPFLDLFHRREIEKSYICLVDGVPKQKSGCVENYLGRVGTSLGKVIQGEVSERHGKWAKTSWEVKKKGKNAALVHCRPATGRTHQIRIHMADMGHPVLGDYRYGRRFSSGFYPYRHLLHARRVAFVHPFSGVHLSIESPIPDLFIESGKQLEISR